MHHGKNAESKRQKEKKERKKNEILGKMKKRLFAERSNLIQKATCHYLWAVMLTVCS